MNNSNQIRIFDTTLRDGEQSQSNPVVGTTGTPAALHPLPLKGGLARRYAPLRSAIASREGQR